MDNDHLEKPRLRNVEPVQVSLQGDIAIGLRDPMQIADQIVCIQPWAFPIVQLFDGHRTLLDIQAEITRMSGVVFPVEDIKALVAALDEAFLLETDRFKQAFHKKVTDFRNLPFRPARHAGMSYSSDPDSLRCELDSFFLAESGPGLPDFFTEKRRPKGIIAPHIDVRVGGPCFAKAYHALANGEPSDVYVILGTGHRGVNGMFTATNLDFESPLGMVRTDRNFIRNLSLELGFDCAAEEILHADEHVIEFQTIFLQHLFGSRRHFTIVPILCSLSHLYFDSTSRFSERLRFFDAFCEAVKRVCAGLDKKVCFIASADLDHIGPRYGDSFIPQQETVNQALERDHMLLKRLENMDLGSFIDRIVQDNDSGRICGFSPITTMLRCMDAAEGRLLGLDYAHVDDESSFVSFSSMVFY